MPAPGTPSRKAASKTSTSMSIRSARTIQSGGFNHRPRFDRIKFDAERLGKAGAAGRGDPQGPAVRLALEPAKRQQTVEDRRANQAADVIAAFAPVETRLAENPPGPRCQIDAEGRKETL